jgi:hypothetical protein
VPLRLPANGSGGDGKLCGRNQACFQLRNVDTRPMTSAAVPPMSIRMADHADINFDSAIKPAWG